MPGGTGYLAEFADPEKVYAMLAAARKVVRECPCREEERLACHRCLLPFAPPHELDKVSRTTALKVLNDILDVGAHSEPDLDDWNAHITEEAPPVPPASDESFLEKDFYTAFIGRLQGMGAAVVEKPGTYGPSATITLQGKKVRRWSLVPQVLLGTVKPDFVLQTTDSSIRPIAIFADGRAFHASLDCNRVADDAVNAPGYASPAIWCGPSAMKTCSASKATTSRPRHGSTRTQPRSSPPTSMYGLHCCGCSPRIL